MSVLEFLFFLLILQLLIYRSFCPILNFVISCHQCFLIYMLSRFTADNVFLLAAWKYKLLLERFLVLKFYTCNLLIHIEIIISFWAVLQKYLNVFKHVWMMFMSHRYIMTSCLLCTLVLGRNSEVTSFKYMWITLLKVNVWVWKQLSL